MNVERLIKTANWIINNIDYYKELSIPSIISLSDFYSIPIIDKNHMRKNYSKFIYSEIQKYPLCENIISKYTSGSSGSPMTVLWNKSEDIESCFHAMLFRKRNYNILPSEKYCFFYGNSYINGMYDINDTPYKIVNNSIGINKKLINRNNIGEIVSIIESFKPSWIITQPSTIIVIIKYLQDNHLKINFKLKYIELTGEMISRSVKNYISEFFGCKVADIYSMTEVNAIAFEDNNGEYNIMSSNVYVEVVDDMQSPTLNEGNIVVTSLCNHVMPFIRYKTGDRGIMYNNNKCTMLKITQGRKLDVIILDSGEMFTPYLFYEVIECVNNLYASCILDFKVIQKEKMCYEMELCFNQSYYGWKEKIASEIKELINSNFVITKLNIIIKYMDYIFPDVNGKLAYYSLGNK